MAFFREFPFIASVDSKRFLRSDNLNFENRRKSRGYIYLASHLAHTMLGGMIFKFLIKKLRTGGALLHMVHYHDTKSMSHLFTNSATFKRFKDKKFH